jgi:hypothetical protein
MIGTLQTWFVQQVSEGESFVFVLAGQAWQVQHLDSSLGRGRLTDRPRISRGDARRASSRR